jgi:hypothetical protein
LERHAARLNYCCLSAFYHGYSRPQSQHQPDDPEGSSNPPLEISDCNSIVWKVDLGAESIGVFNVM